MNSLARLLAVCLVSSIFLPVLQAQPLPAPERSLVLDQIAATLLQLPGEGYCAFSAQAGAPHTDLPVAP